ncbi:PUA-like domain-containing protein [Mycena metata]|uniref:PUA-like domain-containing protein n=1 Tax=Mycena metata TaxID=1033252 RepID=A0AAD7JQ25_9AGAR|nr:PUA-like domain-containing protein [Mycena metata]
MGIEDIRRRFSQNENLYPAQGMYSQSNISIDARYGAPKGVPIGKSWESRQECSEAGVHAPLMAGISGSKDGAFSIVMSGMYEDAVDEGDTFVYIGTGGKRDSAFGSSGPQVADQSMDHPHNKALAKSYMNGRHVRVVRGPNHASPWAPLNGYRYDGLYTVTEVWEDKGRSGFKVCKFRFVRLPGQPPLRCRSDWAPLLAKRKRTTAAK